MPDNPFLFSLMPIPSVNVLDGLDGNEFAVVNVDIVSNTDKRFIDISNGIYFYSSSLQTLFIEFSYLLIQAGYLWIEKDDSYDVEGN